MLSLILLVMIVSLLPVHSAAVTQKNDGTEPTVGAQGNLISLDGVVYKPSIPYYEKIRLDKCSCVTYLWQKTQDPRIRGWGIAKNIPIESIIPFLHGFAVTYESNAGHLLEYRLIGGKIISTDEANWIPCQRSWGREVDLNNIKGFIELL